MKSHAAKSATARRTVARTVGTAVRKDMDNFVKRAMSSSKERKEEAQGVATYAGWSDGAAVARAVSEWRPLKPPGHTIITEGIDQNGAKVTAEEISHPAPAHVQALFAGRTFKMRDAIHPKEGAEK